MTKHKYEYERKKCPNCGHIVYFSRAGNLDEELLAHLRASEHACARSDLNQVFPNYSKRSITNALDRLQREGKVENFQYGYWRDVGE